MFEPLFAAPIEIQIHAYCAMLAIGLGPLAIFRKRRDILHKITGYLWVVSMAITVASSFLIFEIQLFGPFSPIHLLSVFTGFNLFQGVRAAIKGDIVRHQKTMRGLYFWALGIAGLFTLIPGRIMGRALFGDMQIQGFAAILVLFGTIAVIRRARKVL